MSTVTQVLDSKHDRDEWLSLLRVLPATYSDIYFHPDYCGLYLNAEKDRSVLFSYQDGASMWIYAFLLRDLPHGSGISGCDIESPYGYGGPLATSDDPDFIERADSSFKDWCQARCVVAEFIRLHPLLNNQRWLGADVTVMPDRETVSLSLDGPPEGPIAFSGNARNMVRRAERAGVNVVTADVEKRFPEFVDLYNRTMDRLNVDEFYYFNERHFDSLKELVRNQGWLIVADHEDNMIGGALFLRGNTCLHYHLSATDLDSRVPGVTNAILCAAATAGRSSGLSRMHLGGGTTRSAEDALLRFKRRMATDAHKFYIGSRVHDLETYTELKASWERAHQDLVTTYGNRILCYRYTFDGVHQARKPTHLQSESRV